MPGTIIATSHRVASRLSLGWALLCLIAICLYPGLAAHAQTTAIVRLEPASVSLAPGETAEILIWIDGVTDLYGAEIHLRYDPNSLQVQDANPSAAGVQISPGPFLDPAQGFVAANEVDLETGEIVFAITLLSPAPSASGSGELARVGALGTAPGHSEWHLENVILATQEGGSIPVETQAALVIVDESQTATVAPTEMLTSSPTAATEPPTQPPPATAAPPTAAPTLTPPATDTASPTQEPATTALILTRSTPEPATSEIAVVAQTPETAGTPEDLSPPPVEATPTPAKVVTQTPRSAAEISLSPPAEVNSTTGLDEGASLSIWPAIIVALTVVLILVCGRRLHRKHRRRKGR